MSPDQLAAVVMMGILLVMVIGGVHLAFALLFLSVVFGLIFQGDMIIPMAMLKFNGVMESEILIAVPLFVFMGTILEKSEVAEGVFQSLYELFGKIRGGLAIATVVTCTIFASCTGVIAATVTTMTLLAVPPMLKRNYNKGLATGVVCAGGSLGILIPPSVMLVMYGPMANLSVAQLFAAALFPGLLLAFLYLVYIAVGCWLRPELAPAIPDEEAVERGPALYKKAAKQMLPALFLIIAVLGSIIGGVASPTEASGVGAFGALLVAAAYKKLTYVKVRDAAYTTLIVTAMVFFIIIGAGIFNSVFLFLGGGALIKSILMAMPFGKWFVLSVMMGILFILGFFISWQGLLYVIVPIFLPVAISLGFDPLWFGLLVCLNLQMSFLTPPFAYAIFFVKGAAPPEVKTTDIYWGVIPFVLLQALAVLLCIVFPELVLWLPRVTLGA
ncbi:TRAP transporter large permease [Dethiosulfatarculus sandiegensis]|uniref:C4-dicarboxylate ABC transporter n=1 Tax=Dethiosulfatarculus sandiegensis TaxID=1429043 RepID=A0A0D2HX14_9BACT|nr:TRAP transporter large permease subunit [Dethiosulfatarculus sandiegensis]KIX14908.1 C4-dicarboxylate ABC transporter [Dethiosulfatarculus sandiegensis]